MQQGVVFNVWMQVKRGWFWKVGTHFSAFSVSWAQLNESMTYLRFQRIYIGDVVDNTDTLFRGVGIFSNHLYNW